MKKYRWVAWMCMWAAMGAVCATAPEGWRPKTYRPDRLETPLPEDADRGAFGALLSDESLVGFFAKTWPGRPCYTLLHKEDGAYALYFVEFGKQGTWTPIEAPLGEDLAQILSYEIDSATDEYVVGADGVSYAFGVKRNGQWRRATAWSPEGDFIPLMGEIASVPGRWDAPDKVAAVRKLVRRIQALYVDDPRPETDRARVDASQERMRKHFKEIRDSEAPPVPKVRLKTALECPEDGDLRVRIEAEGLPADSDFEINTQENWCQIYAVALWKDADGKTRHERMFRAWYPNLEYKISPMGTHVATLSEMTPVLREMILGVCPDPSRLESAEVALSWGSFSSKKFSRVYYGRPIAVPLQPLPVEALRKNLKVKSTPLSQRDQSEVLARDAQGRLTRFKDRFGNLIECEYHDVPVPNPQWYAERFKEIGAFSKDSYALRKPSGVKRLLKNGELAREEGDLGDGVWYARGRGDYETYELCDYARRRNLSIRGDYMQYTVMDAEASYRDFPQKSAQVAGARDLTAQQALAWMADFEALDVAVTFSNPGGTPALYLVVSNRSGKTLNVDENMKVDVSFWCGVKDRFLTGTSGGSGGVEAPLIQGGQWRFKLKEPWSTPGRFLHDGIESGRLPAFDGIAECSISLRVEHLAKDPRLGAIVFETAQIKEDSTPGLRTALAQAAKNAPTRKLVFP